MPVDHSLTFCQLWDNLSAVDPLKPPRYLVPVTTVNPRWLKCALARSIIAGLTTSMDLVSSGKYPLAGPVVCNKLITFIISLKIPQPLHCQHTMVICM